MRLVDDPKFDKLILAFILMSSMLMAAEGPPNAAYLRDQPGLRACFYISNIVLLVVFWLEFTCKVLADGFLTTPNAYLKIGWNRLDFIVLLTASFDVVVSIITTGDGESLVYVRAARVLRVLRPLRVMKANETMLTLLEAITKCLPVLFGAFALGLIFFLVFAIFGMSLFMGKFYTCNSGLWIGLASPYGAMHSQFGARSKHFSV